MSDLERLLKLSGQQAQSQTQETTDNREMKEAVGEFAEPIYDLIDMHFEGDCQPVFDDLVRYLSGDQIKDFVADFRRHHDLPSMDEVDADTEESVEPTEPSTEEGNKFSGELAQAKKDGKDEFEVDGEKYKVKKEEFSNELEEKAKPDYLDLDKDGDKEESMKKAAKDKEDKKESVEEIEEATGKCKDCGCIIDDPKPGCDCPHDVHDASQDNWVKEANRLRELSGMASIEEETPVDEEKSKKPYPGEYDYTDEKYMDADGTPKSDDDDDDKKKSKESVEEAPVQEADKTIPVNKLVPLAMDSIWDEDKENPKQIMVKSITVENPYEPGGFLDDDEDDGYRQVNVEHDGPWHIYTDSGFEKAISGMVGFNVDFTEQGMQQDGMASMEGNMEVDVKSEAFAGYKPNRFKDMPKGMNEEDKVEKEEETIEEAPTMDTTQLITLLKNAGLTEEQIKQRVDEWANTPAVGASEDKETSHGEPYENFAQSVNLSLKRYLDAEDFKVQGLKEHKVEDIKEAYKKSKESKKKEDKKD